MLGFSEGYVVLGVIMGRLLDLVVFASVDEVVKLLLQYGKEGGTVGQAGPETGLSPRASSSSGPPLVWNLLGKC